jgi:hypothetical protein
MKADNCEEKKLFRFMDEQSKSICAHSFPHKKSTGGYDE